MTLNIKKSNYVIFHPYQKKTGAAINLRIFDNEHKVFKYLERKNFVKYLGVLIDNNLSWKYHIDFIALKISKTIGIISRLRHFIPTSILLNIYRSLIYPYISYGLSVWGQTSKTNLNKILTLQKRALRLIYFVDNREHAIPLFLYANILPVDMLYYKSISILMYDIHRKTAPPNLLGLFSQVDSVHSYNTRSASAGNFYINYSRLKQQSHSFSRIGCKIWNELPESLRMKNKSSFKKHLQDKLLQLLRQEETYVDVHTIIHKSHYFFSH